MCEGRAATMSGLWDASLRVSQRGVRGLRAAAMRVQKKSDSEARRWQRTRHPAHGIDSLLASGRHPHVGPAIHGVAIWQTAGVLQRRGGTARIVERPRYEENALDGARRERFRS